MSAQSNVFDAAELDDDFAPETRDLDVITSDVRSVPDALNAWRRDLGSARHRVLTSLSGIDDDTDLTVLRAQLIDAGLQRTEEQIVSAADATIKRFQADLDALESVAWRHDLNTDEAAALPALLATVTESAAHASGPEIVAEIESAILRSERENMAAWAIVAPRLRNRRDIPAMERNAIQGKIAACRSRVGDRSLNGLTSQLQERIGELRAHRNDVVDLVSETDEVPSGPLQVYRFGRRGVNGGYNTPRRPTPTAKWFRQRIGRRDGA